MRYFSRASPKTNEKTVEYYFVYFSHNGRLSVEVTYTVTKDGHVQDIHLIKESENELFNMQALNIVKKLDCLPFLRFPSGAPEQTVRKTIVLSNHLWYDDLQAGSNSELKVHR